jgi:hypothetical protein
MLTTIPSLLPQLGKINEKNFLFSSEWTRRCRQSRISDKSTSTRERIIESASVISTAVVRSSARFDLRLSVERTGVETASTRIHQGVSERSTQELV